MLDKSFGFERQQQEKDDLRNATLTKRKGAATVSKGDAKSSKTGGVSLAANSKSGGSN